MSKYYNRMSYIMQRRQENDERRQVIREMSQETLEKVKNHPKTVIISYPKYKESYDYVDELFPDANIKEIKIYQCESSYFDGLGYKRAKGFYLIYNKIIIISSSCSNNSCENDLFEYKDIVDLDKINVQYSIDEVLVHEMIHYVSGLSGITSTEMFEEEFAYGNSVEYFKKKGYSEEDIISQKLIVFLYMLIVPKILKEVGYNLYKFQKLSLDEKNKTLKDILTKSNKDLKKEIYNFGKKFIEIHGKSKKNNIDIEEDEDKFKMIDL